MEETNIKSEIISYIDLVLAFATALDKEIPKARFSEPTEKLLALKEKFQNNSPLTEEEILDTINTTIKKIINWNPVIKCQLEKFWQVQKKVIHELYIKKIKEPFLPMRELDLREKQAEKIFKLVVEKMKGKEEIERLDLYALFFSYICKFDGIEEEVRNHIKCNMTKIGLTDDLIEDLFFINEKVNRYDRARSESDTRAIRNALSHMKFEIIEDSKIKFVNKDKGYDFEKTFALNEFMKFIYDHEILYKSQLALAMMLVLINRLGRFYGFPSVVV